MRKFMLVAIGATTLAALTVAAPSVSSADTDVFQGTWISTDHDGSQQLLDIRGSAPDTHAVRLYDSAATVACQGAPAHVQGTGDVDENTMVLSGTLTCQPRGNPLVGRISILFTYSPSTDTLSDESGVTWVPLLAADAAPSRADIRRASASVVEGVQLR